MPASPTHIQDWLASPAGEGFRQAEIEAAAAELGRMFGPQFLQVGLWGDRDDFLGHPGTARRAICDGGSKTADFVARPERLPVSGQTVDGLLLPHTLELTRHPHEVLRESERVLVGGGRIMILGFNPYSMLGVRRFLSRGAFPPGLGPLVSGRRLRDWLALLGFDIIVSRRYFSSIGGGGTVREKLSQLPFSHGAYMVVAIKRVAVFTPLRRLWRAPAKVPAGRLVEPSTRNRH